MTPTYYLHNGQLFEIDRMPPDMINRDWRSQGTTEQDWHDFHTYLSTLEPIPHTFTGESRVIPPNQIEWKMKCDAVVDCDCKLVCSFHSHSSRRVATPKITEGGRDATECASVNNGGACMCAKEGYDMTQCPHYISPLTTQSDKQQYPGREYGLSEFEWQMEQVIDEIRSKETTLECIAPLVKFLESQQSPPSGREAKEYFDRHKITLRGVHAGDYIDEEDFMAYTGSLTAPSSVSNPVGFLEWFSLTNFWYDDEASAKEEKMLFRDGPNYTDKPYTAADLYALFTSQHGEQEPDWRQEYERLNALINNPELENFIEAVKIEAAHQLERWGIEKEEREPPHHYILVATKLLGKLSIAIWDRDIDKFKHHCITLAAEMHNVHRQVKKKGTVVYEYFNSNSTIDLTQTSKP